MKIQKQTYNSENSNFQESNNEIFIKLASNSTNDVAYVFWGELDICSIDLFDSDGDLLSSKSIVKNMDKYEIQSLSAGEYFVQLNLVEGESIVKKVTFL